MLRVQLLALVLLISLPLTSAPSVSRPSRLHGSAEQAAQPGAAATASPSASPDPEVASLAARLRAPFTDDSVAAAVHALALASIPTVTDDLNPDNPLEAVAGRPSPMTFASFQARNMAREVADGGGIGGQELDALAPVPPNTPSLSYLLAAYARSDATFGARLSGALLDGQPLDEPPDVTYPMLVIALFVSDVTASQPSAGNGDTAIAVVHRPTGGAAAAGIDACAAVSTFIDSTLNRVADALSKAFSGNFVLQLVVDVTIGLLLRHGISALKDLLLNTGFIKAITTGISALAIVATVASSLRDWGVSVTANPTEIHDTVEGGPASNGQFRVTVDDSGSFSLPQLVSSCAGLLDIKLPPSGAAGSKITWKVTGIPGQGTQLRRDDVVPESRVATLDYTMNVETQDAHLHGTEDSAPITAAVRIERQDRDALKRLIEALVDRTGILAPAMRAVAAPIEDQLDALTLPSGFETVIATFHTPPQPTPAPTPTPTSSPCSTAGAGVDPGHYSGTYTADESSTSHVGSTRTTESVSGTGPIMIRVAKKGSVSGTFQFSESGQSTTTNPTLTEVIDLTATVDDGTVSGTTKALVFGGTINETLQATINGVAAPPASLTIDWPQVPGIGLETDCQGDLVADWTVGAGVGHGHIRLTRTGP